MRILLTNDDGYAAPGLLMLKQALSRVGEVLVLAPEHNFSASGHVKTMHKPLRIGEVKLADGSAAYAASGAPSDCVALVLLGGVPSIAVSVDADAAYPAAAGFAARLAAAVFEKGLPRDVVLNVNVPVPPIRGVSITRMGKRLYCDELIVRRDPRGRPYYWIGGDRPSGIPEAGTDIWAVQNGLISVTPLQLDMTGHAWIAPLQAWNLAVDAD